MILLGRLADVSLTKTFPGTVDDARFHQMTYVEEELVGSLVEVFVDKDAGTHVA